MNPLDLVIFVSGFLTGVGFTLALDSLILRPLVEIHAGAIRRRNGR